MAAGVSPWAWHAHPDVWLLVAGLLGGYAFVATRRPASQGIGARQVAWFVAGVAALWLGADWPVHDLGEDYLLSVHMLQHLLFTLVAPPMLLLGLPLWLARRLLRPRLLAALRPLARPVPAAVVFNAVIVVSHWPTLVDFALRHEAVHFGVHAVLLAAALLMWLPVVSSVPEIPRLSHPGRIVYLFLQSVVPTVPASFLAFAEGPVYRFYTTVPHPFGLSAVEDQQLAGVVMKIGGGALLWGIIVVLFFRWYALEQRDRLPDVLTWDDVEREFERTPPPSR